MRPVFYERKLRPYNKFNGRFLWRLLLLVLAVVVGNAIWKFGEKQVARYQSVKQTAAAEHFLERGEKAQAILKLRAALGHDARNIQANRLMARLMDEQSDPRALEYYRFVVLDDGVLPGELADINTSGKRFSNFPREDRDGVMIGDRFLGNSDGVELSRHATESDAEALARAGVKYGNARIAREVAITIGKKWNRPEFPWLINAAIHQRNGDLEAAEEALRMALAQKQTPETLNSLADFLLDSRENVSARSTEATALLGRVVAIDQGAQGLDAIRRILELNLTDPGQIRSLIAKYRSVANGNQEALFFADGMELEKFPAEKDRIIEGVVSRSSKLSVPDRVLAVRWLLSRNEPLWASKLVPVEEAITDPVALELAVESLFASGKWTEAEVILRSPQNPLPAHQTGALLAISASKQRKQGAIELWSELVRTNNGNPEIVIYLLSKAASAGEWELVFKKLPSVLSDPSWSLEAYVKILAAARSSPDQDALLKIHDLAMNSRILAGDPEVRDRIAFDRMIAGVQVPERELSERVASYPENPLIRTTRALGLLLSGSKVRAMYELEESEAKIDPEKLGSPQKAVFAAVLAANGRSSEAEKIADTIPEGSLMPGEAEFLRKHLDAAAGAD